MANVTVPKEFFVKERRMYSNWQFAFWRELFQNSTDVESSQIRVNLVDKGNRLIGIEFEDNGCGMSRDLLETVYFRLGASTKNDGSTVGGFGRARILTCFSMKNYTIHTQNNLVQGDGGSYEIADADYRKGCLIQVEMENENYDAIYSALHEYLSHSQLRCVVTVNGKRWTEWCHRRTLTRTLDLGDVQFAHVYVNKSAGNNRLLVRVNGTVMYSQQIRAKAQVIVEIDPSMSREVLTANRDGMHTKYFSILSSFIEELTVDTMASLQSKLRRKNSTIRGRGLIFSINRKTMMEQRAAAAALQPVAPQVVQPIGLGQGTVGLPGNGLPQTDEVMVSEVLGAKLEDFEDTKGRSIFNAISSRLGEKFLTDLPDIFIIDETDNENVRKVIDRYNPENWVTCEGVDGKTYNKGGNLYKLLMLWKFSCQHAIDSLMEAQKNVSQIVWSFGWVFSDTAEGKCKSVQGGHAFLLNPVDSDGKVRFSLRSKEDQKILMAIAKHEVAHSVVDYHNEEFASILTDIDKMYSEKEMFRKMQSFLTGTQ